MVLLTSANGDRIELQIVDYQFAKGSAASADGWDDNWLIVAGRVSHGPESWAFHDPSLMIWEAQELLKWLRSVATGLRPAQIDFTEPNLSFDASAGDSQATTVLVTLRAEAASPSTPEVIRWGAGVQVALDLSLDAVERAASAWENEISAHPSR
ncbi:WapI family immunity protein [Microbacterium sp.]|uniref:WapI family immunity protein n=1 Tax=Microbacterium sp. TaxID=51671 RepID=UPI003F717550